MCSASTVKAQVGRTHSCRWLWPRPMVSIHQTMGHVQGRDVYRSQCTAHCPVLLLWPRFTDIHNVWPLGWCRHHGRSGSSGSNIKRLAVKDESSLVHLIKLSKMTQSPGTGIRTFVASLWGQAALCQYVAPCTEPGCIHEFDFSEEIINDNLVRGIAEPEIMSDLLGDPKTDRTLEETVYFIVTRSAVGDCAGATCNTTKPKLLTASGAKCWACGGPAHGPKNDRRARSRSCEAWTFTWC